MTALSFPFALLGLGMPELIIILVIAVVLVAPVALLVGLVIWLSTKKPSGSEDGKVDP